MPSLRTANNAARRRHMATVRLDAWAFHCDRIDRMASSGTLHKLAGSRYVQRQCARLKAVKRKLIRQENRQKAVA